MVIITTKTIAVLLFIIISDTTSNSIVNMKYLLGSHSPLLGALLWWNLLCSSRDNGNSQIMMGVANALLSTRTFNSGSTHQKIIRDSFISKKSTRSSVSAEVQTNDLHAHRSQVAILLPEPTLIDIDDNIINAQDQP